MAENLGQQVTRLSRVRTPGQHVYSLILTAIVVIGPLWINFLTFFLGVVAQAVFMLAASATLQERQRGLVNTPFQKQGAYWITLVWSLVNVSVGGAQRDGWSWPYAVAAALVPWVFLGGGVLIDRLNGPQHSVDKQIERDKIDYDLAATLVEAWDNYDAAGAVRWAETLPTEHYDLLMRTLEARKED